MALMLAALLGLTTIALGAPASAATTAAPAPPSPISFATVPAAGPATSKSPAFDTGVVAPAVEVSRLKYTGTATTAYSKTPITNFGAAGYGCGLGYVNDNFTSNYVGVGSAYRNQGYSCGQCARLQCDDDTCDEPGKQLIVEIIDTCGDCEDADLSISAAAFMTLTGRPDITSPSALVSWEFIDCSPYINGTIKMLVKSGGSIYYQALNFSNSRYVITAAEINGERLTHGADNFWSWNPGSAIDVSGTFTVAILGANGQVLAVSDIPGLRSTDLGVQFTPVETAPSPSA